jgi:hypothetical protein
MLADLTGLEVKERRHHDAGRARARRLRRLLQTVAAV